MAYLPTGPDNLTGKRAVNRWKLSGAMRPIAAAAGVATILAVVWAILTFAGAPKYPSGYPADRMGGDGGGERQGRSKRATEQERVAEWAEWKSRWLAEQKAAEQKAAEREAAERVAKWNSEARPSPPVTTIDQALARLKSANVAFNTPDRARVAKTFVIEAKLSSFLGKQELKVLIEESGTVEVATLKVSDRMVATLAGGSSFDVSPMGPQEQWVSDVEPTGWTWQVTPKTAGENQVLILTFDAVISINGKDDKRTINTFKRHINVDVGWPETPSEWLELIKKTGENISWIWMSLLIPIGGGAWAWLKARKRMSVDGPVG